MSSYLLDFYTSYHQFYIGDKDYVGCTDVPDFWTPQASEDRLAVNHDVLGIGTECYGPVKAELFMLASNPGQNDLSVYDHVVESSVSIKNGVIQILSCPTSEIALQLNVNPGIYQIRVFSSNLNSVDGDEGDDFYKIEIWPGVLTETKVLKRYLR